MKRPLYLAVLAPLAFALAACSTPGDDPDPEPAAAPDAVETTTTEAPAASEARVERTNFIVFIEEPEPLTVFADEGVYDRFTCAPHSEVGDALGRPDAPTMQLFDGNDELLATQEVAGTGPIQNDVCSIHIKILQVPVAESYRVVFSGEDGDGAPYEHEGVTEFDQGKFDEGYTQSYRFELS
ncbi:hypothetical protein [Brachybacterium huguangmaarense]